MTPVFERAKTIHALDSAAAVIGAKFHHPDNIVRRYKIVVVPVVLYGRETSSLTL
jgi:hypothetical protein